MPQTPTLFFAWWCPHCHHALLSLKKAGLLERFSFVSVFLTARPTPEPIRGAASAWAVTEDALHKLGVHIPENRLFVVLPNSPINSLIQRVPTLIARVHNRWYVMNGAPTHANTWRILEKAMYPRNHV